MTDKKVLVTGAAGFVGSYLVKALLEVGYSVRASVRDKSNTAKIVPLMAFPKQERLEIVEADLLKPSTWDPAVAGCDFVFHAAAPVMPRMPKDESLMVKPMLEGTMNLLKACANHPEVRTVVITSSEASIISYNQPSEKVYTEEDWAELEHNTPYAKGKLLSEKAALEFHAELNPGSRFKLVIINPTFVFGPALIKTHFASGEVIRNMMSGEAKELWKLCLSVVDVRDVVKMHIKALELDKGDRQRYICYSGENMWLEEIAQILRDEFEKYGYQIPTNVREKCPTEDKNRVLYQIWGKSFKLSNEKAKKEFGMSFISAKEAVLEMAYSLIKQGAVPDLIHK